MPRASNAKPAAGPDRRLDDFLCFAIYSANLAFGKAYKPVLDELGLTYTQYIALIALYEGGEMAVRQLGERIFLESNTLTPILKKLEERGLVTRQRDTADERQVVISLTPEGRRLRERAATVSVREATGLTPEAFAATQQAVATLRDNLVVSVGGMRPAAARRRAATGAA